MPPKRNSKSPGEPMISEAMLSEYIRNEGDPRWYFNLVGVIAAQEPIFWEWMNKQVKVDTLRLMGECPQSFVNPVLAQELGKILVRAYVRSHLLGVRKYEASLSSVFDILQMPNEPKFRSGQTPPPEDDASMYGEVDPGDLEP